MRGAQVKLFFYLVLYGFSLTQAAAAPVYVAPPDIPVQVEKQKKEKRWLKRIGKRLSERTDEMGRLALFAGIASFVSIVIPIVGIFSPLLAVAAVVLGMISLIKGERPRTKAVIGLLLGSLYFILIIIVLLSSWFPF